MMCGLWWYRNLPYAKSTVVAGDHGGLKLCTPIWGVSR